MTDSKPSAKDAREKPVRKSIEDERERKKLHEDEVVTSSDDSFPASDPPSFTGVTSAADVDKKQKNRRLKRHEITLNRFWIPKSVGF